MYSVTYPITTRPCNTYIIRLSNLEAHSIQLTKHYYETWAYNTLIIWQGQPLQYNMIYMCRVQSTTIIWISFTLSWLQVSIRSNVANYLLYDLHTITSTASSTNHGFLFTADGGWTLCRSLPEGGRGFTRSME